MPNPLTIQVIGKRLAQAAAAAGRPEIEGACRYGDDGPLPRRDEVDEADYLVAKAIIEQTLAEGERRFKTPLEFWAAFAAYPASAQAAALKWTAIVVLRKLAVEEPELFAEVFHQAALEIEQTHNSDYLAMQAAGLLEFDPLEIETNG